MDAGGTTAVQYLFSALDSIPELPLCARRLTYPLPARSN